MLDGNQMYLHKKKDNENGEETEPDEDENSEEKVMERLNQCVEIWCGVSFSQ